MARKIIKQTSSFGVLRANPRISGNVKITVDSNSDIWLNSIDSNAEMSNQSYKGFRISPESSYDKDLYTFFNNGSTPSQFIFGLVGESDPFQNQTNELSKTYNMSYSTGVSPLVSDKYPENFSYLAPLWLGKDIPDYFVIFKVSDPIDYPYQVPVTTLVPGKTYKVIQDPKVDTSSSAYVPFQITSGYDTYTDGNIFVATLSTFTVNQGEGSVLLLDPLYHLNDIKDSSSHFYNKILPKSTIVATFDLGETSKIGKYLRKIQTSPGYSDNLIDVRFEDNQLTTYNGVNYSVGIFDKKGDFLFDYFKEPQTQIGFEDFITDGFRRNGIISYKLLNLEFLFNDIDSDNYTINRYFGLYVNAPEISSFRLDGNALYRDQGTSGNTPVPLRNDKGYYNQETSYYQYNDNGVRLFVDENFTSGVIPNSDTINIIENTKLFWIKDKNGDFHSLKRDENYSLTSPSPEYSTYGFPGTENSIVLHDTSVDLSIFTGENKNTKKQYEGVFTGEKGRAYSVIRIGGQLTNTTEDVFIFYHPLGTYGIPGSKYDIIKSSDLSSVIDEWGPGSYYAQDNAYYYHPFGTNEDIAKALNGIFNSFNYNSFESFQSGDEVIIRVLATGKKENSKYGLDFYQNFSTFQRMPNSRRGLVYINEKDVSYINQKQSFIGGSDHVNSRIKVKIEEANKIEVGETFIETVKKTLTDTFTGLPEYTNKNSSLVIGKYRFVDEYSKDQGGAIVGLKDFESHATLEVENFLDRISLGSTGKISAFNVFEIPLGIFSFYGLRELDSDFWYSEYGYTPTAEYYKYLDTQPEGTTKIVPGKTYFISDGVSIDYNSYTINGPDFFEGVPGIENYSLISVTGTPESNVYPTLSTRGRIQSGITILNFDSSFYPDLDAFPGFYGIQALKFINNEIDVITKKDQVTFGKLDSEYDYTQDNYNPDFAIKSRVSPYISKWTYRGGTDVRGNGYRLNSNIAFSPLNFSPSFFRRSQDPQYFTHEWYQLQRPPYSLPEDNLHKDKNYLSNELDESLIKDANPSLRDYFLDYFSVEGEDFVSYYFNSNTIDNINLSERYSVFDFNTGNGFAETLFRGAKVRIKRTYSDYGQGESIRYLNDDLFYDGYKFSCVIVPIKNIPDKIQPPIKIKILENRTFKNITFVINVLIDDARIYDFDDVSPENQYLDLDYFLLYSLKDKLAKQMGNTTVSNPWFTSSLLEIPMIGDIKLSSALNISSVPTASGLFSSVNSGTIGAEGEIYIIPNSEYETDLREEVGFTYLPSTDTSLYATGSTGPGSFYGVVGPSSVTGTFGYTLPFPTGIGQDTVNFTNTSSNYIFNFSDIGLPGPVIIPTIASPTVVSNIPIYQREGGVNYWRNILEKISFANISLWINTGYPYIEYRSYVWDETTSTTTELKNQFVIEFIKPSAFEQNKILVTEEITNKPSELSLFNIGYTVKDYPRQSELYRYSGGYVPKFREILKFENVKYDIPYWTTNFDYTYKVKIVSKLNDSKYFDLGSNYCYEIDGKIQNIISLIKGVTYIFDLSDPSNLGYQLYFSKYEIGNNLSAEGLIQGYNIIGTPGTPGSFVQYEVPYNISDSIYYVAQGGNYMGQKIKLIDSIEYSYCSFGPNKDDFGSIKNINFYKYSTEWIYRIGKNSPYNPVYNLIGETPIDRRDLSLFESSWDPGYYRQYTSPTNYTELPGTRSMQEIKSFFGSKVMQTPNSINSQKQIIYPTSLSNVLEINYDNYPNYEILWENTSTELRGIILMDRILTRYFLEDGAKETFQKFIVPEFGFGSLSDINDDFREYMRLNVTPIYQSKNNGSYLKKIPVKNDTVLDPVIGDLADYQKITGGYLPSQEIRYTKVNELRYEFRIPKDPSFNYSLSFSLQIGKI